MPPTRYECTARLTLGTRDSEVIAEIAVPL
jgi:hypothetical protein